MTIAISISVNDGVVLAADSAMSMTNSNAAPTIVQVYNNANKIINLCKSLPVGVIFWGNGAIGNASISTLMKDLRDRFSGKDKTNTDWKLKLGSYKISDVAAKVKKFVYDELYTPAYKTWPQKPAMGMLVAGYSAGGAFAEEFKIDIDQNGACTGPLPVRTIPTGAMWTGGAMWAGEPEAITRLLNGFGGELSKHLAPALNLTIQQVDEGLSKASPNVAAQIISDAMPIKDVIDVAEFLVELTSKYSRYTPGAATVGGPVEIAAITKHEGFRWVKRKLYFTGDMNPEQK